MINKYNFFTESMGFEEVETKAGKKHYITGYISTKSIDLVNDIVTQECLKDMLLQCINKNITVDVEHEAFRDNPNIIPVGRIIDAKLDSNGLWVKAEMNEFSPKFANVWGSVVNKFLKAFSIAFKPIKTISKSIGGKMVRLLEQVDLLNVAITGNPVNPDCTVGSVFIKSILELEGEIMADEQVSEVPSETVAEQPVAEQPAQESVPVAQEESQQPVEEIKHVEEKADSEEDEEDEDEKKKKKVKEAAAVEEKDNEIKSLKDEINAMKAEIKSLNDKIKAPIMKSVIEVKSENKIEQSNWKGPVGMIR